MLWKPKTQYFGSLMLSQTFKHLKLSYKLSLFDEKISDKGPLQITEKDAYAYDTYYKVIRGSGVLAGDYFLNGLNKVTTHVAYSGYQRRKEVFRKDMETLRRQLGRKPIFTRTLLLPGMEYRRQLITMLTK